MSRVTWIPSRHTWSILVTLAGLCFYRGSEPATSAPSPSSRTLVTKGLRTTNEQVASTKLSKLPEDVFDVRLRPPVLRWIGNRRLVLDGGTLQPGTRKNQTFNVPKLDGIGVVLSGDSTMRYALRSPGGKTVVPGETPEDAEYHVLSRGSGHWILTFKHPEVGQWDVAADAATAKVRTHFSIDVRADDPIVEQAHLEVFSRTGDPRVVNSVPPGEAVYVRVFIATDGRTVPGVRWNVKAVAWPEGSAFPIAVWDDGRHADGSANDGVFVGAFVAEVTTMYLLQAETMTPKGIRYTESSRVEVEEGGDLFIADSIAVSPNPRAGNPVTLTVTVMNQADRDAHNASLILFLTVGRNTWEVGEAHRTFDLHSGKSMRISTAWTPTEAHDYEVWLSVHPSQDPTASNTLRKTVVKVR